MTFGQLLVNICNPIRTIQVSDCDLLNCSKIYSKYTWGKKTSELTPRVANLLELATSIHLSLGIRFAWTIVNVAGWTDVQRPWFLYDIEDDVLLRGAK